MCLTLCNPMDCSPPGSSVYGVSQARILECGVPFLSPGDLPHPGIERGSVAMKVDSLPSDPSGKPKEPACQCRRHKRCRFDPWVGNIPWRRTWQPTPVFLPGEFYGQRSLVGYSPWGHKESNMTEHRLTHLSLTSILGPLPTSPE